MVETIDEIYLIALLIVFFAMLVIVKKIRKKKKGFTDPAFNMMLAFNEITNKITGIENRVSDFEKRYDLMLDNSRPEIRDACKKVFDDNNAEAQEHADGEIRKEEDDKNKILEKVRSEKKKIKGRKKLSH